MLHLVKERDFIECSLIKMHDEYQQSVLGADFQQDWNRRGIQKGNTHTHTLLMPIWILWSWDPCVWISDGGFYIEGAMEITDNILVCPFCAWGNHDEGCFADKSVDPDALRKTTPGIREFHQKFLIWTGTCCLPKHNEWVELCVPESLKDLPSVCGQGLGYECLMEGIKTKLTR